MPKKTKYDELLSEENINKFVDHVKHSVDDNLLNPEQVTKEIIIDKFNQQTNDLVNKASLRLHFAGTEKLIDKFISAFPHIRNWYGRNCIIYDLIEFARKYDSVYNLAINALHDRSFWVRMRACDALGYSLRKEAIPFLKPLCKDKHSAVRFSAENAIRRIENQIEHDPFLVGAKIEIGADGKILGDVVKAPG